MPRFHLCKNESLTGVKCKQNGSLIGFLPLRELSLDVDIIDSIAVIKMIQDYANPFEIEEQEY